MSEKLSVIITAAGDSLRMKGKNKLFLEINHVPVLLRTIRKFYGKGFHEIILVLNQRDLKQFEKLGRFPGIKIVTGGETREESVLNGLKALQEDTDYVLIHDGARPFVSEEVIKNSIEEVRKSGATVASIPATDTIKEVKNAEIVSTPERETLFLAQTPQAFSYPLIMEAFEKHEGSMESLTDDASLVEQMGSKVTISRGDRYNLKITTPEDLIYAEALANTLES